MSPLDGRLAHQPGRGRLGLGGPLDRFGCAEGGVATSFRLQHDRRLPTLGAGDVGLAHAFRLEDHRALFAFGLHLPRHGVDEVLRRLDVLDFDARHLDSPGLGRGVDDGEQAHIDLVAMRQELVEVHASP